MYISSIFFSIISFGEKSNEGQRLLMMSIMISLFNIKEEKKEELKERKRNINISLKTLTIGFYNLLFTAIFFDAHMYICLDICFLFIY